MEFRQIVIVIVALIVIVGAALFIVSWGGDGDDAATEGDDTGAVTVDDTSAAETSVDTEADDTDDPTTTTTSIPAPCSSGTPTTPADPAAATDTGEATDTGDATDTGEATDDGLGGGGDDDSADSEPIEPTLGENSSVSTVGLDTVPFGLTVFQAEQAAGTEMAPCDPVGDCYRVAPVDAPEGIVFVVTEGTIERVDIVGGPITTRSGVGIGTQETRIVELFGNSLEREVNDDSSIDLIFVPSSGPDADFRVVFTIRDGVVDTFRSGRLPFILDDQPCV